jgi:hypothetical protein
VGAVIINTALAIGAFLLTFALFLVVWWPEVPWDWLTPVAIAVSLAVPVVLHPWAKTIWMAYDLAVHPPEAAEIEAAARRAGQSD